MQNKVDAAMAERSFEGQCTGRGEVEEEVLSGIRNDTSMAEMHPEARGRGRGRGSGREGG